MRGFIAFPFSYSVGGNGWHAGDIAAVPLDRTAEVFGRLRALPEAGARAGIYGVSRGAEHALLSADLMSGSGHAACPEAVAVHAPPDVIHAAFRSAAYMSDRPPARMVTSGAGGGDIHLPTRAERTDVAWTWNGSADRLLPGTAIRLEAYKGALFMSHGRDDRLWSADMTRRLHRRAQDRGIDCEAEFYEFEDHVLSAVAVERHLASVCRFFARHL